MLTVAKDGEEHVGTVATRSVPTHVSSSRSLSSPEMVTPSVDSRPRSRSSPDSEHSEPTPNFDIEYECRRSVESLVAASSVANLVSVSAASRESRDTPVQNHRVGKHMPAGRLRESVPLNTMARERKYYKRESDDGDEDTIEYANFDDGYGDNDPGDEDIVDYENIEDDNGDNDHGDDENIEDHNGDNDHGDDENIEDDNGDNDHGDDENIEDDNGDNDHGDDETIESENYEDDNGDHDHGDEAIVEYENVLDDNGHNNHSDDETIESENDEDQGDTGSDGPTTEDNGEDDDLEELNNEDNGDNHNSLEVDHEDNTPMEGILQPALRRSKRLNAALEQTDRIEDHRSKATAQNKSKSVQKSRRVNTESLAVAASAGSTTNTLPDIDNKKIEIERVLTTQRTSGKLWLKIKWKGIPTGSWELAEYMRSELGEEDYQELLETKPRKRRKKASAW
jgi:hypothetical protein